MSDAEFSQLAREGFQRLPEDVRDAAYVNANGEVEWPWKLTSQAIDALADAGIVILGLDLRTRDQDGRISEVVYGSFEPDKGLDHVTNVAAARTDALEALTSIIGDLFARDERDAATVLITWSE
jgi:hypothetical protein